MKDKGKTRKPALHKPVRRFRAGYLHALDYLEKLAAQLTEQEGTGQIGSVTSAEVYQEVIAMYEAVHSLRAPVDQYQRLADRHEALGEIEACANVYADMINAEEEPVAKALLLRKFAEVSMRANKASEAESARQEGIRLLTEHLGNVPAVEALCALLRDGFAAAHPREEPIASSAKQSMTTPQWSEVRYAQIPGDVHDNARPVVVISHPQNPLDGSEEFVVIPFSRTTPPSQVAIPIPGSYFGDRKGSVAQCNRPTLLRGKHFTSHCRGRLTRNQMRQIEQIAAEFAVQTS